jgi:transcriptional regulator with XRE-family HTH domain
MSTHKDADVLRQTISTRIRAAIESGSTQAEIAQQAGVSQSAISKYLRGRTPKVAEITRLAKAVGLHVNVNTGHPTVISAEEFTTRTDILCNSLGVTVRDLAARIGISSNTIFLARAGTRHVSPRTALRLAEAEKAAGIASEHTFDALLRNIVRDIVRDELRRIFTAA